VTLRGRPPGFRRGGCAVSITSTIARNPLACTGFSAAWWVLEFSSARACSLCVRARVVISGGRGQTFHHPPVNLRSRTFPAISIGRVRGSARLLNVLSVFCFLLSR
jgi:hypothetical protein